MKTPFEDDFEHARSPPRCRGGPFAERRRASRRPCCRSRPGPDWIATQPGIWHIESGRLCGEHARNHGIWLKRTLPVNARIEFDAISQSTDGDLKAEYWGDGRSFATRSRTRTPRAT